MYSISKLVGIALVVGASWIGWLILGGVTLARAGTQGAKLTSEVAELWGAEQNQMPPALSFHWKEPRDVVRTNQAEGKTTTVTETVQDDRRTEVSLAATNIAVDLSLNERRKGLLWYALYDVSFDGQWTYEHKSPNTGDLEIRFQFPDPNGFYDDFRLVVNGTDWSKRVQPGNGDILLSTAVKPGERIGIQIAYRSRGLNEWRYVPGPNVSRLDDFHLIMRTDFQAIDFPARSMSPTGRERKADGWELEWRFEQAITGFQIGMLMPQHIQPGELASALSFSAPISLLLFFLVLFTLSILRGIELHPINYLFLAAAFFAFHLLFAYTVDRLSIAPAFLLTSVVSLFLVVSYLRLVVGPRFAFVEAGVAQLVYLVGFALAHFFEGFTGLAVTVLSIVTLFVLMQATARVRWDRVVGPGPASAGT